MPANHRSQTRIQSSHLVQPNSNRTFRKSKMVSRWRGLALAIVLGVVSNHGMALAQYPSAPAQDYRATSGDLPASPWSTRDERQSSSYRDINASERQQVVRQPATEYRPKQASEIEPSFPLDLGPQPTSDLGRPAPVTLMGPVASSRTSADRKGLKTFGVSNRASKFTTNNHNGVSLSTPANLSGVESIFTAAPHRNALTQKTPSRSDPEWHRVDAGGIQIVDALPGLPERDLELELGKPTSTQTPTQTVSVAQSTQRSEVLQDSRNAPSSVSLQSTEAQDETSVRKASLAQRVSYELLSNAAFPASRTPESLEVPTGWGAIEQELKGHLERCDALLKRNAIMSARSEATLGLRRLCSAMDSHRQTIHSGPALERAFTALREDADFQNLVAGGAFESISSLVGSHSTEALKGRKLEGVSAEIASQHYRTYARYQFVVAADGHRWAAELLYAYGKTLEKEAELDPDKSFSLRSKSVACYQAAIQISPSQSEAASQLGYALINLDRMDEAQGALVISLQHCPTASAWNNLAELHRRRGAHAEAEYAIQQATSIAQTRPNYSPERPEVTEVDPATFAKYSPMSPPAETAAASGVSPATSAAARAASAPSFLSKIFTK